jgi:aerobic-type carbon monoxide dehydrogenase small subunit (CoxS/CutS family)
MVQYLPVLVLAVQDLLFLVLSCTVCSSCSYLVALCGTCEGLNEGPRYSLNLWWACYLLQVSFDDSHITTADGKVVSVFDANTLSLVKQHTLAYVAESASYCRSKQLFAAGGEDMWVRLYNFQNGEELEINKGHHGPVHTIR